MPALTESDTAASSVRDVHKEERILTGLDMSIHRVNDDRNLKNNSVVKKGSMQ